LIIWSWRRRRFKFELCRSWVLGLPCCVGILVRFLAN
jgi:hypothetical protein